MRILAALVAALSLGACTPEEVAMWNRWREVDPVAADSYAADVLAQVSYGRCGHWRDDALGVGWAESDWPTLNRVMYGESRCEPSAQNPSGASGLLQIMPMWADDCGGQPADLFDSTFNLSCGLHVLAVQGWQAWSAY